VSPIGVSAVLGRLHFRLIHTSRATHLASMFAAAIPPGSTTVLDVGCGDGLLAREIGGARPELTFTGLDVVARDRSFIRVQIYDGQTLPAADRAYDVVMFSDVLHHAIDPDALLCEAARVARKAVVIKDHLAEGRLDRALLRGMDWVGNSHSGVSLPYTYWPRERWRASLEQAGLRALTWNERPRVYAQPLSWIIGRDLHLLTVVTPQGS
jgi:SAM-dependent methyltransferase